METLAHITMVVEPVRCRFGRSSSISSSCKDFRQSDTSTKRRSSAQAGGESVTRKGKIGAIAVRWNHMGKNRKRKPWWRGDERRNSFLRASDFIHPHSAFDRYREPYPRKSELHQNCYSRDGDEQSAVPACV
jgi:hypothetical protein